MQYTLDSIFRQRTSPLSVPYQQNLAAYFNARPRLCNGHCHYVTGCRGFQCFLVNSKACSSMSKHFAGWHWRKWWNEIWFWVATVAVCSVITVKFIIFRSLPEVGQAKSFKTANCWLWKQTFKKILLLQFDGLQTVLPLKKFRRRTTE